MPSALMGLVAFSFTLLVFGGIVYSAALPSLIVASQQTSDGALLASIFQSWMAGDGAADAQDGTAAEADGKAEGSGTEAAQGKGAAADSPSPVGGGFTLSGTSLQGMIASATGSSGGSETEKPEEGGTGGSSGGGGSSEGGSGNQGGSGGGSEENPSTPEEPDPAEEQAFYEFLLGKAQLIDGYVAEVNACVADFNTDCLNPSRSVRESHARACDDLSNRLFAEYSATVNYVPRSNYSKYNDAHERLIAMFRTLGAYTGSVQDAWDASLKYEDPAAHADEVTAAINRDNVNGQNKYLTEFQQWASGFTL